MGILFIDQLGRLQLKSDFYFYGAAASPDLAQIVANDIARYWNMPNATVNGYPLHFEIRGFYSPDLPPETVWYNTDPVNNYFRIEEYCALDISFVDDIGSNTGYFKLANLLHTGTTAAHEYGHTLGLEHPDQLDIRGQGAPGIMYPRGTVVDANYQYNPLADAGDGPMGGTMDATKRVVTLQDIEALGLHKFSFKNQAAHIIGGFSSQYHEAHRAKEQ